MRIHSCPLRRHCHQHGLAAADTTLIPVQAQYLSAKGLEQLLQTIQKVRRQINPKLKIEGILMTMTDSRTNYGREIDLFNWQNSVKDMISQIEFVRMVDVQSETVDRYIKDGKSSRIFLSRLATSRCSTISAKKVSETLPSSTAGISSRRKIWQISS